MLTCTRGGTRKTAGSSERQVNALATECARRAARGAGGATSRGCYGLGPPPARRRAGCRHGTPGRWLAAATGHSAGSCASSWSTLDRRRALWRGPAYARPQRPPNPDLAAECGRPSRLRPRADSNGRVACSAHMRETSLLRRLTLCVVIRKIGAHSCGRGSYRSVFYRS